MAGHIPDALSCDWCTPDRTIEGIHETLGGPPDIDPCSNPWSRVRAKVEFTLEKGNDGLVDPWPGLTGFCNPPFGKGWWKPREHQPQCNGVIVSASSTGPHCACGAGLRRDYIWPSDRAALAKRVKAGELTKAELKAILKPYKLCNIGDWIKLSADFAEEQGKSCIGLIPAYPGTKAWQQHVWPRASRVFFPKGRLHFRLVYQTPAGVVEKTGPAPMDCALPLWSYEDVVIRRFEKAFGDAGYIVTP